MIKDLEKTIGYRFRNIMLLQKALTHSSYANENWHDSLKCNERLEFLGDAVLGMVTAEHLYAALPDKPEGVLTRTRADLVCETALACAARKIRLGEHLLLGHGEEQSGGSDRDSILADATEAVIAAIYLDGGFEPAKAFIETFVLCSGPDSQIRNGDYKTALQEKIQQKKGQTLSYRLTDQWGPDHDKHFVVQLQLNGIVVGQGSGSSKKRAEQEAAKKAMEALFPNNEKL